MSWICGACTYADNAGARSRCEVCDTPRVAPPQQSQAAAPKAAVAAAAVAGANSMVTTIVATGSLAPSGTPAVAKSTAGSGSSGGTSGGSGSGASKSVASSVDVSRFPFLSDTDTLNQLTAFLHIRSVQSAIVDVLIPLIFEHFAKLTPPPPVTGAGSSGSSSAASGSVRLRRLEWKEIDQIVARVPKEVVSTLLNAHPFGPRVVTLCTALRALPDSKRTVLDPTGGGVPIRPATLQLLCAMAGVTAHDRSFVPGLQSAVRAYFALHFTARVPLPLSATGAVVPARAIVNLPLEVIPTLNSSINVFFELSARRLELSSRFPPLITRDDTNLSTAAAAADPGIWGLVPNQPVDFLPGSSPITLMTAHSTVACSACKREMYRTSFSSRYSCVECVYSCCDMCERTVPHPHPLARARSGPQMTEATFLWGRLQCGYESIPAAAMYQRCAFCALPFAATNDPVWSCIICPRVYFCDYCERSGQHNSQHPILKMRTATLAAPIAGLTGAAAVAAPPATAPADSRANSVASPTAKPVPTTPPAGESKSAPHSRPQPAVPVPPSLLGGAGSTDSLPVPPSPTPASAPAPAPARSEDVLTLSPYGILPESESFAPKSEGESPLMYLSPAGVYGVYAQPQAAVSAPLSPALVPSVSRGVYVNESHVYTPPPPPLAPVPAAAAPAAAPVVSSVASSAASTPLAPRLDIKANSRDDTPILRRNDSTESVAAPFVSLPVVSGAIPSTPSPALLPAAGIPASNRSKAAATVSGAGVAANNYHWNDRYNQLFELPETSARAVYEKHRALSQLTVDFCNIAAHYAQTIIYEYFRPTTHAADGKSADSRSAGGSADVSTPSRTLPPRAGMGGFAGGQKYVVDGILFKLAQDFELVRGSSHWLYGGPNGAANYEYAQKAAGHELKGASHYHTALGRVAASQSATAIENELAPSIECPDLLGPRPGAASSATPMSAAAGDIKLDGSSNEVIPPPAPKVTPLRVPMQALVDFAGFRLIAMPLLPIGKSSLVWGSNNAGRTVADARSHPEFRSAMIDCAHALHLAAHAVSGGVVLHSAADVEGHIGSDNRMYLLDLARCFPPESPYDVPHLSASAAGGTVFYRLLRPELLQLLKQSGRSPPLSPDAFTNFTRGQSDVFAQNQLVRDATSLLLNIQIPLVARELDLRSIITGGDWESWQGRVQVIENRGTLIDKSVAPRRSRHRTPATVGIDANPADRPFMPVIGQEISCELHRYGVNIRHLALVRRHVTSQHIRFTLFLDMLGRVCKNLLRDALRREVSNQRTSDDPNRSVAAAAAAGATTASPHQLKQTVVTILNRISGCAADAHEYWQSVVLPGLDLRFGTAAPGVLEPAARSDLFLYLLSENDRTESNWNYHAHVVATMSGFGLTGPTFKASQTKWLYRARAGRLYAIISYATRAAGISLTAESDMEFAADPYEFEFTADEVILGTRIKHMSSLDHSMGLKYLFESNQLHAPAAAASLRRDTSGGSGSGAGVIADRNQSRDRRRANLIQALWKNTQMIDAQKNGSNAEVAAILTPRVTSLRLLQLSVDRFDAALRADPLNPRVRRDALIARSVAHMQQTQPVLSLEEQNEVMLQLIRNAFSLAAGVDTTVIQQTLVLAMRFWVFRLDDPTVSPIHINSRFRFLLAASARTIFTFDDLLHDFERLKALRAGASTTQLVRTPALHDLESQYQYLKRRLLSQSGGDLESLRHLRVITKWFDHSLGLMFDPHESMFVRTDYRLQPGNTTALHRAASMLGQMRWLPSLIAIGSNLDLVNEDGLTPLMMAISTRASAAYSGDALSTGRVLLDYGANPFVESPKSGLNALMFAIVSNQSAECISLLCEAVAGAGLLSGDEKSVQKFAAESDGGFGLGLERVSPHGWRAIHYAARHNAAAIPILLSFGASVDARTVRVGQSALHVVCSRTPNKSTDTEFSIDGDAVEHTDASEIDVVSNAVRGIATNPHPIAAASAAAAAGAAAAGSSGGRDSKVLDPVSPPVLSSFAMEVVRTLVNSGNAWVGARDADGVTPLMNACESGHLSPVVAFLVERQIEYNRSLAVPATAAAAASKPPPASSDRKPIEIDTRDTVHGMTALARAAKSGDTASVRLLISSGANVNGLDCGGATPLVWAVWFAHISTCRVLLEAGADPLLTARVAPRVNALKLADPKRRIDRRTDFETLLLQFLPSGTDRNTERVVSSDDIPHGTRFSAPWTQLYGMGALARTVPKPHHLQPPAS